MGGSSKRRKRLDSESYLLFRLKLNTISSKVIVLGTKLGKKWGGKNRTQPRDSLSRAGIEPSNFCKNMLFMSPAGRAARAQTGAENPRSGFVSWLNSHKKPFEKGQQKTQSKDSLNRSQYKKTALLNTTPWPRDQVVCKWFSAPTLNQSDLALASVAEFTTTPRPYIGHKLSCCHEIEMPPDTGKQEIFALTRRDSNLEAFSYNLSNGSFRPLICRSSLWTKCLNPLFLSY